MEFGHMPLQHWIQRQEFNCPGCGRNDAWEYDRHDVVVTLPEQSLRGLGIASSEAARMGGRDIQTTMQNTIDALLSASRQTSNQVVKVPCGNCGYVLFLDRSKIR